MVPPGWEHPRNDEGRYKPLYEGDGFKALEKWMRGYLKWQRKPESDCTYSEWCGAPPDPDDYMGRFPKGTATHFMMYETCSEGTPLSPPCATAEDLARWLATTGASACGSETATYEEWLGMIGAGSTHGTSFVIEGGVIKSGVAFAAKVRGAGL